MVSPDFDIRDIRGT